MESLAFKLKDSTQEPTEPVNTSGTRARARPTPEPPVPTGKSSCQRETGEVAGVFGSDNLQGLGTFAPE